MNKDISLPGNFPIIKICRIMTYSPLNIYIKKSLSKLYQIITDML